MIRIREVLERIAAILRRLALGVRLLGGLSVLAGLAILASAISAGALHRGAEGALYKTLGGAALGWAVLHFGMQIDWLWPLSELVAAPLLTALLAVTTGLAASLRALQRRPAEVFRQLS